VSLTATNDSGSNTLVKNDYIRVYQREDIDCDDLLGLSDIILLLQIVAGSNYAPSQQCQYISGDRDSKNHLGLGDAISAMQKVAIGQ